ncbi:hypothetical protein GGP41_006047 [Bipolaris sorokiniana]|uniref:Uncharacterized protein n=1 Tax=Cochliobolus sativus TaxID=45130 RepID=A0A8H6DV74_COCSA|nr:hypothetical protein GGP41_006047 [Bipolaris sorokiniana]
MDIRINQLQVIDTHNSYRVGRRSQKRKIIDRISSIIQRISSLPQISTLPIASSLGNVRHLQVEYYSHEYIYSQLEHQSVRSLEFDLRTDDNGKLYSRPSLWKLLKLLRVQPPFDSGMFNTSGIKVFHSKDLDLNPVCHIFKDCLHQTNRWSDAHRTHVPIIVSLELKTDTYLNGTAKKLSKSRSRMESPSRILNVDTEILSVFPLNLQNRTVFTNALEGSPDAAFIKHNDSLTGDNYTEIQRLVKLNYMVRTHADVPFWTVLNGVTEQRERAAEWRADSKGMSARYGSNYTVELSGGGAARCNPVDAPVRCRDEELE